MNSQLKLQEILSEKTLESGFQLVPVHVSKDEILFFNIMQGGQSVDENTGLREYSRLSDILKIPEIRNTFILVTDLLNSGEEIPQDLGKIMDTPLPQEENGVEEIQSDHDPRVKKIMDNGTNKDNYVVMMPENVVMFLDFLQGGHESYAPYDHLQQFGFLGKIGSAISKPFKQIGKAIGSGFQKIFGGKTSGILQSAVRIAAPIAGGFFGGPLGAAFGSAAGNIATGKKLNMKMLGDAAKSGLFAWGAGSALNAMGKNFGALGSNSGTGSSVLGNIIPGMSSGVSQASATATPGVWSQLHGNDAISALGINSAPATATGGGGMLGNLNGVFSDLAAPAALIGGGYLLSKRGEKQNRQDLTNQIEEENRKRRQENEEKNSKMRNISNSLEGVDLEKYYPEFVHHHRSFNPRVFPYTRVQYKKGGIVTGQEIKGAGKGQDDFIPKTVKEKSWVWDATTVGHLGDGATNAGQKAIEKLEKIASKKFFPKYKNIIELEIKKKPLRNVPCALSNGERVTPAPIVAAIGKGSFDKGAKVLRKITKDLRKHKTSKRLVLPPPAYDLMHYYKKAARSI